MSENPNINSLTRDFSSMTELEEDKTSLLIHRFLPSTVVTHSCFGKLTGGETSNLVVGKHNHIELYSFTESPPRLQLLQDLPVSEVIACLDILHPPDKDHDFLFFCETRGDGIFNYSILEWDFQNLKLISRDVGDFQFFPKKVLDFDHHLSEQNKLEYERLKSRAYRTLGDRISSQNQTQVLRGPRPPLETSNWSLICLVDSERRCIYLISSDINSMTLYWGNDVKVEAFFPPSPKRRFRSWRKYKVLSAVVFDNIWSQAIAVLHEDVFGNQHLSTVSFPARGIGFWTELKKGVRAFGRASMLIHVPRPIYGVLIVGINKIAYHYLRVYVKTLIKTPKPITNYSRLDGEHYLLGDGDGFLYLLRIVHQIVDQEARVTALEFKRLGETSIASAMSCLNGAYVYIGSELAYAQLLKLNFQLDAPALVEVEKYLNLGPLEDICIADLGVRGTVIVTFSGYHKYNSLHIIKNGWGFEERESRELECVIKDIWEISSADNTDNSYFVLGIIDGSIIVNASSLSDAEFLTDFEKNVESLFCHGTVHDQILQVTPTSAHLIGFKSGRRTGIKRSSSLFTVATADASQVLLAERSRLISLQIGAESFEEERVTDVYSEVSCIALSCPRHSSAAAVGTWERKMLLFSVPNLEKLEEIQFQDIPHSVLFCSLEEVSYLFCGFRDGSLHVLSWNTTTKQTSNEKKFSLGKTQVSSLHSFVNDGVTYVCALSDWPALIFSKDKKLQYFYLNLVKAYCICPISADLSKSFAVSSGSTVSVGCFIQGDPSITRILNTEFGRCICHQQESRTYAFACSKLCESTKSADNLVQLLDDCCFDCLSIYKLDKNEAGRCIISCRFENDYAYYCLGTGFLDPHIKGRILLFKVQEEALILVGEEASSAGGIHALRAFRGGLLAYCDDVLSFYKLKKFSSGDSLTFILECTRDLP